MCFTTPLSARLCGGAFPGPLAPFTWPPISRCRCWHRCFAKRVNNNLRAPLCLTCLTFFPGPLPTFDRQYNLNKYSLTHHVSPQIKNAILWLKEGEKSPTSLERALMFKLCTHSSLPTHSLFHHIVREIHNPEEVFEINQVYCLSNWWPRHLNKGQWGLWEQLFYHLC